MEEQDLKERPKRKVEAETSPSTFLSLSWEKKKRMNERKLLSCETLSKTQGSKQSLGLKELQSKKKKKEAKKNLQIHFHNGVFQDNGHTCNSRSSMQQ